MPPPSEAQVSTIVGRERRPERIAGIVLAAGTSRRMGLATNKLLLEFDGEPMIRRITRGAIEADLDPVLVVTGHESARVRDALSGLDCSYVESPDPTGPTSTSLHAGLLALGGGVAAVVVMLGDMVRVRPPMMRALADGVRDTDARLAVSRYGAARILAPPLLFRRTLWPELLAYTGEGCGKSVAMAHLNEAVVFDWPADSLRDIDTPADYDELR